MKLEKQNSPFVIGIDHNLDLIKNSVHRNTQNIYRIEFRT